MREIEGDRISIFDQWRTKEGTILNLVDMKTSHIKNCIALMDRNLSEKRTTSKLFTKHRILMFKREIAIRESKKQYKLDCEIKEWLR